ncbi:hypothetical protein G9A89_006823 [Geosiphon pyriformis]|nr:hypothetical protein G9A89_006823 [Geosiphon pyriformis]
MKRRTSAAATLGGWSEMKAAAAQPIFWCCPYEYRINWMLQSKIPKILLKPINSISNTTILDKLKQYNKASSILGDVKIVGAAHCTDIWVVRAKYKALIEKGGLILLDSSVYSVTCGLSCMFSAEVIKLLEIAETVKVKGYSGISDNVRADLAAGAASGSPFSLCADVREHFLVAEGVAVSGNARHFVRNIFQSIRCTHWEAGPGCDVVPDVMVGCINWVVTAKVWHPDSHMLAGFTSRASSSLCTYVIKAVHRRLPVAIRKRLYDKCYPSVLCLLCGEVEFFDHVFTCVHESGIRGKILAEASARWSALSGGSSAFAVLWVLSQCSIDVGLYTLVCKGFVLEEWYEKTCDVFEDRKMATARIVEYVRFIVGLHRAKVWLAKASHQVVMEKAGLVCDVGVVSGLPCGVSLVLSDGVVRLLGLANFFAVSFGRRKPFCFFSGLGGSVRVVIDV